MVELCSTQHFGGTNTNITQSACTDFHQNTGVILPVDWAVPLCSLALTRHRSERCHSRSPAPVLKAITASASLIGGTLWRRPLGLEGLLVGTSPYLVCSHSALDLTNRKPCHRDATIFFLLSSQKCVCGNLNIQYIFNKNRHRTVKWEKSIFAFLFGFCYILMNEE